jgi:hypothetical protein
MGSNKLFFPGQFKDPTISTLLVPFGELPRNSVFWLFMGSSHSYTLFSALVEVVSGCLLFLPRLDTMGGALGAAAMANVAVLNASYDVAVKTYYPFRTWRPQALDYGLQPGAERDRFGAVGYGSEGDSCFRISPGRRPHPWRIFERSRPQPTLWCSR